MAEENPFAKYKAAPSSTGPVQGPPAAPGAAAAPVEQAGGVNPFSQYQQRPQPQGPVGPQEPPPGVGERITTGMADPAVGMAQMGARAPLSPEGMPPFMSEEMQQFFDPSKTAAGADQYVHEREKAYEDRRTGGGQSGTDWYRLLGNVLSPATLPLMAVPGGGEAMAGRAAMAALAGAAGGAAQPVTGGGDYWSEKAKQMGLGGAAGGAMGAAGSVIAPLASRATDPLAQMWDSLRLPQMMRDTRGSGDIPIGGGRVEALPPSAPAAQQQVMQQPPNLPVQGQIPGAAKPGVPAPAGGSVTPAAPSQGVVRQQPPNLPLSGQIPGAQKPGIPAAPGGGGGPGPSMGPQYQQPPNLPMSGQVPGPARPGAPVPPGGSAIPTPQPSVQKPSFSTGDSARMLEGKGVSLTPGQRVGRADAERRLQAWPILRGYIQGAAGRSVDDFDRAVVRQALEPIAGVVPKTIKAGHPLMDHAEEQLGRAYDQVKPHLTLSRDGVVSSIEGNPELRMLMQELPDDTAKQLTNIIQNRILGRFGEDGKMDGNLFKKMEGDLSRRAQSYVGTNQNELGRALYRTLGMLREELTKQNPQYGPELQKINAAWSMFERVREAAGGVTSEGKFTPKDLLAASSSHPRFAHGDAPMQAFAEAGTRIIGKSFPNYGDTSMHVLDVLAGAAATPPYAALSAIQRAPGVGQTLERLAPVPGEVGGADIGKRRRSYLEMVPQ